MTEANLALTLEWRGREVLVQEQEWQEQEWQEQGGLLHLLDL